MNYFTFFIIATILIDLILDIVANYLNIKNLQTNIPQEFEGIYEQDTYTKSQKYLKERTNFDFITTIFNSILFFSFWYFDGFIKFEHLLSSTISHEIGRGVLYIYGIFFMNSLINMPFRLYSTFVIEEKYGFNKTTPMTYFLDIVKGLGLTVVLGVPLLGGVLWVFNNLGAYSWLYGFIGVSLFSLVMQYLAPTFIMPLFNKFTPLEDGELKSKILEYTAKVQFPLTNLFVIDGSKRSTKANAYFTGFGKNKRIALYDTLIENHTIDEIVAVLAHEIGHFKLKHIIKGTIISFVQTFIIFFLLSQFLNNSDLYLAFGFDKPVFYAGLLFFGILFSPIELILSIFMNIFSRKNEFEADEYSAKTSGMAESLISALKKLSKQNLSNLTPHPFYEFINYSHPTVLKRIEKLRKN